MRLRDQSPPGAIPLVLPARSMRGAAIFMAVAFVIFAAIEWMKVTSLFSRPVNDVFDIVFAVFQGFWALGWLVGVVILGTLAILLGFYSESARIESWQVVHIASLGPLKILVDYDVLVPVPGVLVFGWDLGNILLMYWAESGVIALYTALKSRSLESSRPSSPYRSSSATSAVS